MSTPHHPATQISTAYKVSLQASQIKKCTDLLSTKTEKIAPDNTDQTHLHRQKYFSRLLENRSRQVYGSLVL